MPAGEEPLRKGTYGALSTGTPPQRQTEPRPRPTSPASKDITASGQSQHNEAPPPLTLCTCRGTTHVPGMRCSRAWNKLLSYSASFSRGPMTGRDREKGEKAHTRTVSWPLTRRQRRAQSGWTGRAEQSLCERCGLVFLQRQTAFSQNSSFSAPIVKPFITSIHFL